MTDGSRDSPYPLFGQGRRHRFSTARVVLPGLVDPSLDSRRGQAGADGILQKMADPVRAGRQAQPAGCLFIAGHDGHAQVGPQHLGHRADQCPARWCRWDHVVIVGAGQACEAGRAEGGKVALVQGEWINAFLDEVTAFPLGAHDDQVDTISGGVQMVAMGEVGYGPALWN